MSLYVSTYKDGLGSSFLVKGCKVSVVLAVTHRNVWLNCMIINLRAPAVVTIWTEAFEWNTFKFFWVILVMCHYTKRGMKVTLNKLFKIFFFVFGLKQILKNGWRLIRQNEFGIFGNWHSDFIPIFHCCSLCYHVKGCSQWVGTRGGGLYIRYCEKSCSDWQ
jgi:hypothetical protein